MLVHLDKDLEQFVHDVVGSGLYPGEQDVIRDALTRLKQAIPSASTKTARQARNSRIVEVEPEPITFEELNRRLLASGLVIQLPNPSQDVDDSDDLPIEIAGEPLSETILRERR